MEEHPGRPDPARGVPQPLPGLGTGPGVRGRAGGAVRDWGQESEVEIQRSLNCAAVQFQTVQKNHQMDRVESAKFVDLLI